MVHFTLTEAAMVAYEMMLQEDTSHPFTNCMSLYCCVKRLQEIGDVQPPEDAPIVADEVRESNVRAKSVMFSHNSTTETGKSAFFKYQE